MIKRLFLFVTALIVLSFSGCIKETYNMKMLSKEAHLSPELAISAAKGDVSLSDIVKTNDTIVFDQNKLVILVFKENSVVDLKMSDFSKGTIVQTTATIEPTIYDLGIDDILDHISGDVKFLSPSITFNYTNSFSDPIVVTLNATGMGKNKTVGLQLAPFPLAVPNTPVQQEVTASYTIDKTNSNLPDLISIPPEKINFSGAAVMSSSVKSSQAGDNALSANHLIASVEIDVPMDLELANVQFADTVDNFLKDDENNNSVKPSDFQLLRVNLNAKNGFPLGASVKMSLYDSSTKTIKSTVEATSLLDAAPVGSDGKATGTTETTTTIEFNKVFFNQINNADKIIFGFTLNTTGNGTQEVKIYSDYRINFTAALVVKPDINLNDH